MRHLLALVLLISVQKAWSWGAQGHMVVAELAQNKLSPNAKKNVLQILGNQSMAEVSNWADQIKGDPNWDKSKPWHFVDIPDGSDYSKIPHSHDGDIVTAITDMVKTLKQSTSSLQEKQNALKFIIHFVGDLHQPLHVGRPDDKGGNTVKVIFEGKQTSLHALWDTGMLMKQNMDYKAYVRYLESQSFADYDIPEFSFSQSISDCMQVRKDIYNFKDPKQVPIKLDAVYMKRNLDVMNSQLISGGQRLAQLLNKIYR